MKFNSFSKHIQEKQITRSIFESSILYKFLELEPQLLTYTWYEILSIKYNKMLPFTW